MASAGETVDQLGSSHIYLVSAEFADGILKSLRIWGMLPQIDAKLWWMELLSSSLSVSL